MGQRMAANSFLFAEMTALSALTVLRCLVPAAAEDQAAKCQRFVQSVS